MVTLLRPGKTGHDDLSAVGNWRLYHFPTGGNRLQYVCEALLYHAIMLGNGEEAGQTVPITSLFKIKNLEKYPSPMFFFSFTFL